MLANGFDQEIQSTTQNDISGDKMFDPRVYLPILAPNVHLLKTARIYASQQIEFFFGKIVMH